MKFEFYIYHAALKAIDLNTKLAVGTVGLLSGLLLLIRNENRTDIKELRSDMKNMGEKIRKEVHADVKSMGEEIRKEVHADMKDLKEEIVNLLKKLLKTTTTTW